MMTCVPRVVLSRGMLRAVLTPLCTPLCPCSERVSRPNEISADVGGETTNAYEIVRILAINADANAMEAFG